MAARPIYFDDGPLWYKDAIIYELHVKAFYDGINDGIGDFKGLTEKLDYMVRLGITAIWLLPFYPSPLKDDGYDISDYFGVHHDYGTMRDFKNFLNAAHQKEIRVIIDLIMNHTSDKHRWFQDARKAKPETSMRNFYVWSDNPDKYKDARIIFKDFESSNWTWDPVAKSYYWHRFYSHQPDLNFDNPDVQKAMFKVVDFWLDMGVDGLRLDAVPYLFEREGTNCENLEQTHDFLKKLRNHVDIKHPGKILLAEANQWPEDSAAYFGDGDSCHMAFHFPIMPRMFMAIQMEDRFPLVDIIEQTPSICDTCQWVIFLRNHDELTLEMVSDEERDYMYKVYAKDVEMRINLGIRRRLAPLMENNRRKIELMNIMLMSFPGTPIIYYGDELGMGDNYYLGDRDGVRTPMQWSTQRNAGFSSANPQKLYLPVIIDPEYHYEAVNVEIQERNPSSLLWWTKHLITVRKKFKSISRGNIEFINSDNTKVIAFTRHYEQEIVLVVINLSRFSQLAQLHLSKYAGMVPEEIFSRNEFPVIKETPYVFTLSFYDYFWFLLKDDQIIAQKAHMSNVRYMELHDRFENVFHGKPKMMLEKEILPSYLSTCRWYAGKARKIYDIEIFEDTLFNGIASITHILMIRVAYLDGMPEIYMIPISFTSEAASISENYPFAVIANIKTENGDGIIYDATYDNGFRKALLSFILRRRSLNCLNGQLSATCQKRIKHHSQSYNKIESSHVMRADQSNSSILYEKKLILKLFRKVEEGINPDIEILRFISEKTVVGNDNMPLFIGCIEYKRTNSPEPIFMCNLQRYVQNEGDAWSYTIGNITRYFENIMSSSSNVNEIKTVNTSMLDVRHETIPELMAELIGHRYIEMAGLLGVTTARLHLALALHDNNPDFTPEQFGTLYQRSLYQSMQNMTKRNLELLRNNMQQLPEAVKEEALNILNCEEAILQVIKSIVGMKITSKRIRIHGDYHLGQVLYRGNEFMIIDFEGEPLRSLSERRLKRSPLRDVASMIRSFHYAPYSTLSKSSVFTQKDIEKLTPWANLWYFYISGVFLSSYVEKVKNADFMPEKGTEIENLLRIFLLDKAIYELGYELGNRPDWVSVPLKGITSLLQVNEK